MAVFAAACAAAQPPELPDCGPSQRCGYRVIERYPHDPGAFTQGLVYEAGVLYEGTGLQGESSLRKVDLETGAVLQQVPLDNRYFGEGITLIDDRVLQLTLSAGTGFIYDKDSFDRVGVFEYQGAGWGLTHDGSRLILSDGSSTLRLLDPQSFSVVGRVEVTDAGSPLDRLNELEYVSGEVLANVWQTDRIARISPESGEVVAWIDLEGLLGAERFAPGVDVLNGIAYDAELGRLFVTGKRWPWLFQIELVPAE